MSTFASWMVVSCVAAASLLTAQDKPLPSAGGGAAADASARPQVPSGLVIGVVDLGKAFDVYPRTIKERERLQKLAGSYDEQIQGVTKRIEELKALLPLLKEGTRERNQKQLEYELALKQRQGLAQLFGDELQAEQMRMQLSIYEDLETAVARLAKDRGVQLVLRLDATKVDAATEGDKSPLKQVQSRLMTIEARQVLFAGEQLDLTPALIKMLQVPLEPAPGEAPPAPAGNGKDKDGGRPPHDGRQQAPGGQ